MPVASAEIDMTTLSAGKGSDPSAGGTLDLEEWKECRATIGRFDTLLVDLRKYGFTLITGLLTASSFWFSSGPQKVDGAPSSIEVGVALVLTFLIVALFVVDRTYQVLQRAAVARGSDLEDSLHFELTKELSRFAQRAGADTFATRTYGLFVGAAQVPWVLSWLKLPDWGRLTVLILGVCVLAGFLIWYHEHTKHGTLKEPTKRM